MGGSTPNIDRLAKEGMLFMDHYAHPSCTAGRSAFITGQYPIRVGLASVGLPGAEQGMNTKDPTLASLLKPLGYATGQFGKNHLGDRDEHLPTNTGFDEFMGILYHLNAVEYVEQYDFPKDPEVAKRFAQRGVIHSWAQPDGTQKIEDWLPTIMAQLGQPDLKTKLLTSYKAGARSYERIHLDGYDQSDLITGKGTTKRKEFYYFTETTLHGVRYGDWKFLFKKQDKWFNGVQQNMVTPLVTNLKLDPFERFHEARGFDEWQENRAWTYMPAFMQAGELIKSLKGRIFHIDRHRFTNAGF